MLREGSTAPAFTLYDTEGDKISLSQFKGKKIVLYFYPKDLTPGCTKQACDFTESKNTFTKKKTIIIGVSRDSIETHQKFIKKHDLDIILLSDPETNVCKLYEVWKEKSLYGKKFMGIERTTFLIDEKGKIIRVFPKVKVEGHIEEVLKLI